MQGGESITTGSKVTHTAGMQHKTTLPPSPSLKGNATAELLRPRGRHCGSETTIAGGGHVWEPKCRPIRYPFTPFLPFRERRNGAFQCTVQMFMPTIFYIMCITRPDINWINRTIWYWIDLSISFNISRFDIKLILDSVYQIHNLYVEMCVYGHIMTNTLYLLADIRNSNVLWHKLIEGIQIWTQDVVADSRQNTHDKFKQPHLVASVWNILLLSYPESWNVN